MTLFRKSLTLETPNPPILSPIQHQLRRWIKREIIDDDPYDELTLEEATLLTRLSLRRLLRRQGLAND